MTERHLPMCHRVCLGNENDAKRFHEVVGTMVERLRKFGAVAGGLSFAFDKGMNSEDGLEAIRTAQGHFLASLKRN